MPIRKAVALALLAAAPLAVAACGGAPAPEAAATPPAGTVELTPAQVRAAGIRSDTARLVEVSLPVSVPATLGPPDSLAVRAGAIVEGRVERVLVLPGDRVRAGDPLVHIHSHELADAQRDLAAAASQRAFAETALRRAERLFAAEAVAREEVERRRVALDQAEADYRRSREIVDHLHPSPEGDVVVRAPRAGTVFAVHVQAGEAVLVGAPLVDLGDASRLWATGWVPERASLPLAPGDSLAVTLEALPGVRLPARVVRLGGAVDSLRRAVEVRAALVRAPAGVRPGMFATLELPAGAPARRTVLPADAVQRTSDGEVVFVGEAPGVYRARAVKTTPLADGRLAVEGLAEGVPVVVAGAYALKAELERGQLAGE
ncbi:MAG TPA: efflux RND transporter periplasmic adaptor subunit [Gemmatimonadales bacterium]|nr:efflux RND transporter periplasmic adaptor subunit [Gemmatimonadales bacterium]